MQIKAKLLSIMFFVLIVTISFPVSAGEVGALFGGVVGGVIGHNVGPHSMRDINTLWGALGGAMVGHMLEEGAAQARDSEAHWRYEAPFNGAYVVEPAPRWIPPPPPASYMYHNLEESRYIVNRGECYEVIVRPLPSSRMTNLGYEGRYIRSPHYRGW